MWLIKNSRSVVIFLVAVTLILLMISKRGECKYKVILKDDKAIQAKKINLYKNGFADIRKCNGKSIIVFDNEIDTIKIIK